MQQLRNVRGEAGEALGIAPQLDRPLQVDMTIIFPQTARLIQVVPQQHKCGITVKIKYRKVHWNASSIWLIAGFAVFMPSGA